MSAWARKSAPRVGATRLDPLLAERDRQGAEAERVVEVRALDLVRLARRPDGDDRLPAADRPVDGRRRDDPPVERDRPRLVDVGGRELAPDVGGRAAEGEVDADLPVVRARVDAPRVDQTAVEEDRHRPVGNRPLLNAHLTDLIAGKEVQIPRF